MTLEEIGNSNAQELGPLTELTGDKLVLRGWRSLSLTNIGAIVLPASFATASLFADGWMRLLVIPFATFAAYGCWAIYRSAFSRIEHEGQHFCIDGRRFPVCEIEKFDGRRVAAPSRMDDMESGTELWLILKSGAALPILQMSGYARIERISAHLNELLRDRADRKGQ